ncbi:hypothetical protein YASMINEVIRUS_1483 [Yasminevirus sp. GU-2018]|uniref:Phospholipid/glycerol acyltransferase domain-containing protein n=1 Tax=Yasminevirus sp. GU-2018 TaxID=2420051 RepID=A0A5K0UB69_9VIRU|nr:hypothetical protein YASMINEVIRUS_1483 [Yasminevirus sp. GU-2018]
MNIGYFFLLFCMLFLFQLPTTLVLIAIYPLKFLTKSRYPVDFAHYVFKTCVGAINSIFFKVDYEYTAQINPEERYVYMPNHQSWVDGVLVKGLTCNRVLVVVTKYAKYIGVFGFNLIMLGFPFVDKNKTKQKGETGLTGTYTDYLKEHTDTTLIIFPEGHRHFTRDFKIEDIKSGGFVIAKNTGQKIIPAYHNLIDGFNDKKMEYDPTKKIFCIVGTPIDTTDKSIEDIKLDYYNEMIKLKQILDSKVDHS